YVSSFTFYSTFSRSFAPTFLFFFFFNATATTAIYTLSLHDALPISVDHRPFSGRRSGISQRGSCARSVPWAIGRSFGGSPCAIRSEGTRLNSSHLVISYAVFCLKKKTK